MLSKLSVYRPLFKQRDFLFTLFGNTISRFGDSVDAIAFSWMMYEVTGSASLMALILAVNYLPTIVLQPLSGVLSEKMNKRITIICCDSIRGMMILITAILFWNGLLSAPVLFAVVLIQSSVEAFEVPAASAFSVRLLPKELYATASALRGSVSRAAELIGLACAGGLVAGLGIPVALMIDAATFFICAASYIPVRFREEKQEVASRLSDYFSELKCGISYARSTPAILALMLLGAMLNFFSAPMGSFFTIFVADNLRLSAAALSAANICITVGMGLGAFVCPLIEKRLSRRWVLLFSGVFFAIPQLLFGLLSVLPGDWLRFASLLIICLFDGFFSGMVNVVFSASFMEAVDRDYMARISGLTNAVLCCTMPVSALLCSGLALFLPVPLILSFTGAIALVFFLCVRWIPGLRDL